MSVLARPLTYQDLDQFPNDGKRREIVGGVLHVAAAPSRVHQTISVRLVTQLNLTVTASGIGEIFHAPVDVLFTPVDLVQPDLIFIRTERLHLYDGNIVHGAPDLIIEILSPSTRSFDEVEKLELYARHGVPEYWIVDAIIFELRPLTLRGDGYVLLPPEPDGTFRSRVIPDLIIDPKVLFAGFAE